MCLLGDVRLIENTKLASESPRATVGTSERLTLPRPASLKSVSMETTTVVVHESMIGSHHYLKLAK